MPAWNDLTKKAKTRFCINRLWMLVSFLRGFARCPIHGQNKSLTTNLSVFTLIFDTKNAGVQSKVHDWFHIYCSKGNGVACFDQDPHCRRLCFQAKNRRNRRKGLSKENKAKVDHYFLYILGVFLIQRNIAHDADGFVLNRQA